MHDAVAASSRFCIQQLPLQASLHGQAPGGTFLAPAVSFAGGSLMMPSFKLAA